LRNAKPAATQDRDQRSTNGGSASMMAPTTSSCEIWETPFADERLGDGMKGRHGNVRKKRIVRAGRFVDARAALGRMSLRLLDDAA
jgi:hypothetical protein